MERIGEEYYLHRQSIMSTNGEGLTKTYNRFHNVKDKQKEINTFRELHIEMDRVVAAAYGWDDLSLGHDFRETKQGKRFTVSEVARREILDRLLTLNHQYYQMEVEEGLHNKKRK